MAARDHMVEGLKQWLMGPSKDNELFGDFPSLVYSCGMLFPDDSKLDEDQNEAVADDGAAIDSSGIEGIPNLTNVMKPSAAGLSFFVDPKIQRIRIRGSFALYLPRRLKAGPIIGGDNPAAGAANDAVQSAATRRQARGRRQNPQDRANIVQQGPQDSGAAMDRSWNAHNVRWHRNQVDFACVLDLGANLTEDKNVSGLLDGPGIRMPDITEMEILEIAHVLDNIKLDMRVVHFDTHRSVTCTLVNRMPCPQPPASPNPGNCKNLQPGATGQQSDSPQSEDKGPWLAPGNSNSKIVDPAERLLTKYKALLDKSTIYQVRLCAEPIANGEFPFIEAPIRCLFTDDPDALQHTLLYRKKREFAVGHGAGSNWKGPQDDLCKAFSHVELDFIPSEKVLGLNADGPGLGHEILGMSIHSGALGLDSKGMPRTIEGSNNRNVIEACTRLVDAYEAWVDGQEQGINGAITELRIIQEPEGAHELIKKRAKKNIGLCREAIKRMRKGVECLDRNPVAMRSFNLANLAMLMQSRQTIIYVRKRNPDENPPSWRPFQLAFLLMSIRSIFEPDSTLPPPDGVTEAGPSLRERDIVDLIWFPTGGGKTEAYLGLIAMTLLYRRLRYSGEPDKGAGVGVITRYTLRLLTSQQFERATRMICALEVLRLSPEFRDGLGKMPFKIGLFVGGESSPNRFCTTQFGRQAHTRQPGANEVIKNIRENQEYANKGRDVRHLRKCPWCTKDFDIYGPNPSYVVVNGAGFDKRPNDEIAEKESKNCSLHFRCKNPQCLFQFGNQNGYRIPAQIIDEEILREPPSVIIGTVDKFAMLAWKEETLILFGRNPGGQVLYPSPDLVIQDELHLISGPLGTIVGSYDKHQPRGTGWMLKAPRPAKGGWGNSHHPPVRRTNQSPFF